MSNKVNIPQFLVVTLVLLHPFTASALQCDRTNIDTSGFGSLSNAESWYPKEFFIADAEFKKTSSTSKKMVHKIVTNMSGGGGSVTTTLTLFTNGKLTAAVQPKAGYKQPGMARYKCDKTSLELASSASSSPSTVKEKKSDAGGASASKSSLDIAKTECADIGYTVGTEKFADCVMKLMDD